MGAPASGNFNVPGATLHYERFGTGPMLLLIPGGSGEGVPYQRMASELSGRYTVVTYDRRGFSRSPLHPQHESALDLGGQRRMDSDCHDACLLIEHFGGGSAHVLGSSSGAIIALHLIARHPERVRALVAHEPPLVDLLPDVSRQLDVISAVYDTYRQAGVDAAMQRFLVDMGLAVKPPGPEELPPESGQMRERMRHNRTFWLEWELRQYPRLMPDERALQNVASRVVLGVGQDSRGTMPHRPNLVLAERLGLMVTEFPGGHLGYLTHSARFAAQLVQVLDWSETLGHAG